MMLPFGFSERQTMNQALRSWFSLQSGPAEMVKRFRNPNRRFALTETKRSPGAIKGFFHEK
jgi:hypothetical protein